MPQSRPSLTGVLETVLYFSDEVQTRHFYSDILGLRLVGHEPGRSLFYRAGGSVFLLFRAEETLKGNTLPSHGASGPIHSCFVVQQRHLAQLKPPASRSHPVQGSVRARLACHS